MCLRFVFLLITRVAAWLRLTRREETWKTTEILILRHQLAALQRRQPRRPKLDWADRALLATLLSMIPRARRQGLRLLAARTRSCAGTATSSAAAGPPGPYAARPAGRPPEHQGPGPPAGPGNPGWGYRRIHGELAGLGVKVAASTVWQILKASGIDPARRRTRPTWSQFLRSQGEVILACDFFTAGLLDGTQACVLAVIEHASRRIRILGVTPHPTGGVNSPAGPQPPHGPRRTGTPGQVHDRRPRPGLHPPSSTRSWPAPASGPCSATWRRPA